MIRCQVVAAATGDEAIRQYIHNGGYAVKTAAGKVDGYDLDTPFVPASTLKLVTSLAALDILGPDYRFTTLISIDGNGNLYIKGEGDPMLTSENVAAIANDLSTRGVHRIKALILDGSDFALESQVDGSENTERPYDAGIGPLAVNFNALPLAVGADGRIDSGEDQTPVLPMMREIGRNMPPGRYRVNVGAFPRRGPLPNEFRYVGELFLAQLRQNGIAADGRILVGTTPKNARLLLSHSSVTVRDIIRDCLEFSNNFIANELFVACGRARFGAPATWAKGRLAVAWFTREKLRLNPATITIAEGSGLSRKNVITPRSMLLVLDAFSPFADLLPVKHNVPIKSGTMTGVYCYAGFLDDPEHGRRIPFSIMLNQETNNRDRILKLLATRFGSGLSR